MDLGALMAYVVFALSAFALVAFGVAEWYLFIRPEWLARHTSSLVPKPSPIMAVAIVALGLFLLAVLGYSLLMKGAW